IVLKFGRHLGVASSPLGHDREAGEKRAEETGSRVIVLKFGRHLGVASSPLGHDREAGEKRAEETGSR
ncbi:hypothetical protein C7E17_27415, partial [Stenotrophomonas maltophilia]